MLKKINKVILLIILIIVILIPVNSQPLDSNRTVIIKSIKINSKPKNIDGSKIVISSKDSIAFEYGLTADGKSPRDAFLFKILLATEIDSSVYNTGGTSISYSNLSKNKYSLTIGAFDLQRRWSAKSVIINFEVDDEEAALHKKLDSIIALNLKANQKNFNTKLESNTTNSLFPEKWTVYIIIVLIIIVLVLLVLLFYRFLSFQKWSVKFNKNKKEKSMQDDKNYISIEEYNRLLTENGDLKAEIAGLRGQIDALMVRGDQLIKQNKELQVSIAKLNSSKDELEELQKQKDELFAVIIHDIKNPAALIKSLAELLTSYDLTATEQQEIINDIAQTTIKIVSLSQEVSKILSIESNKMIINFEKNNLNEVVYDVSHRNSIAAKINQFIFSVN
jgi:signal transduction histidine kinase